MVQIQVLHLHCVNSCLCFVLQGLLPSSISLTVCWSFLLIEALLLVEINVGLLRKKKMRVDQDELEVISIRTMAQETLGEWGGALATGTYIFLGYTSMIAYSSKSGEILYHLINLPESVSGVFFTALFSILIAVGGTRATDQVNRWLTTSMIGIRTSSNHRSKLSAISRKNYAFHVHRKILLAVVMLLIIFLSLS